ncbi:MAG TPA: cell division protein FtsL [Burkholderiales bacterium]|nr:cell division protein FtsL [Burkholderiales bacterium]
MIKVNAILAAILVVCALVLVTSQHKARKLFVELQKQQDQARQLEVEYGQLQLEQSTWAMHSRVEKIAANSLQMRVPPVARVHLVPPLPASSRP